MQTATALHAAARGPAAGVAHACATWCARTSRRCASIRARPSSSARDFAIEFIPEVAERIEVYPGERPIFDLYAVEDEIQKALERKVLLKSGGYLVSIRPRP